MNTRLSAVSFYTLKQIALQSFNGLRSKRFREVGEQRKTKERYFARAKLGREPK